MAFAEDIVKNETNADECTIIMRQLFHQSLDQRKAKIISDTISRQSKKTDEKSEGETN